MRYAAPPPGKPGLPTKKPRQLPKVAQQAGIKDKKGYDDAVSTLPASQKKRIGNVRDAREAGKADMVDARRPAPRPRNPSLGGASTMPAPPQGGGGLGGDDFTSPNYSGVKNPQAGGGGFGGPKGPFQIPRPRGPMGGGNGGPAGGSGGIYANPAQGMDAPVEGPGGGMGQDLPPDPTQRAGNPWGAGAEGGMASPGGSLADAVAGGFKIPQRFGGDVGQADQFAASHPNSILANRMAGAGIGGGAAGAPPMGGAGGGAGPFQGGAGVPEPQGQVRSQLVDRLRRRRQGNGGVVTQPAPAPGGRLASWAPGQPIRDNV